ncbi:Serine/threonine-protein phosphatase 2A activator 1 [Vanrija pseudolonga]|uniref:Serine/threonine-protein phosphatase 2A activator n=1 Tax=Vanrija pseudolonga TaxID=143232 RepID=A0AAF0Y0J7_9TREE|nr:Serine/threonine-protein phosphatase 2A activator 1 [Vanrija pseudolonga]
MSAHVGGMPPPSAPAPAPPPTDGIELPSDPFAPAPLLTTEAGVQAWPRTPGYQAFNGWLKARCGSIKGKEIIPGSDGAGPIGVLMRVLDALVALVDEVPPLEESQRFGNRAFRRYIALVEERLPALLDTEAADHPLPPHLRAQILPLLLNSHAFGHPTRLDYGTGHELAFALALFCCVVSGWVVGEEAQDELVLRVFPRYLDLVTKLQATYRLEPAGSHGVWGLDDYAFLPYLFGSAQLLGSDVTPAQALVNATSTSGPFNDLYTLSLHRITLFKRGAGFAEHSPLLHSLSTLPSWVKPHGGLVKMYAAEVLGKRVVVQGLWVGGWAWGAEKPHFVGEDKKGVATVAPSTTAQTTAAPWAATARPDTRADAARAANASWGAIPQRR